MKKPEIYNSKLIDSILDSITPEEEKRIANKMLLAAKIDDAIKAKGWKRKDFMKAMKINNQSVITKWLSGTHNFTTDTLTDIGSVLGISLLNLKEKQEQIAVSYRVEVSQQVAINPASDIYVNIPQSNKNVIKIYSSGTLASEKFLNQTAQA